MNPVTDFARQLGIQSKNHLALWHKIDLHNHTPTSYDYLYHEADVVEKMAEQIIASNLSVVMFTDHESLPKQEFIEGVKTALHSRGHTALVLTGVELNVFVEGFDFGQKKYSDSRHFYHMLVGFDPDNSRPPDYWLQHIYQTCHEVSYEIGGRTFKGVSDPIHVLKECLKPSNAVVIPAHLHTDSDLNTTRSIDNLYSDETFLKHARENFTALEVVSISTARFFDGNHVETGRLYKGCVRSSDSHQPSELGRRHFYAQLEQLTFADLKAALELPWRIALEVPDYPESYVEGIHVAGSFLSDVWLRFSPHCNVLIGVKGSGKTSVLECLRFVLGADVPQPRTNEVNAHLQSILGSTGKITALIKRNDSTLILISRSLADPAFEITFEDGDVRRVSSPDALHFPVQILGWHEIEQAAGNANIRRAYMDAMAGKSRVRELENEASSIASRIKDLHEAARVKYRLYSDLDRQVSHLQELRDGLQTLTDNSLIALRDEFQHADEQRQRLKDAVEALRRVTQDSTAQIKQVFAQVPSTLPAMPSPIEAQLSESRHLLSGYHAKVEQYASQITQSTTETLTSFEEQQAQTESLFRDFLNEYNQKLEGLSPEQRRILESHRDVLEQTRTLSARQAERDSERLQLEDLLRQLVDLCEQLAKSLDQRTELRRNAVDNLNQTLASSGVRLELDPQQASSEFTELSNQYREGAQRLQELRGQHSERGMHRSLRKAYSDFLNRFDPSLAKLLFASVELALLITKYETDDLQISLKVGKPGQEFSPINQLSAGQKCTAIFPILLSLDDGPLVVDQPEDNLDNRYIASFIADALRVNKRKRQMVFTSHNANLVVLSDAESIVHFDSDGTVGKLECQGFFAHQKSAIRKSVMEVLDGGESAIKLRSLKYGLQRD
jgi:DNA repair ATPase RecN